MDNYIRAEKLTRRLYEKRFNLDLSLPIGHSKNRMKYPDDVEDMYKFWDELGKKYVPDDKLFMEMLQNPQSIKLCVYSLCQNHKQACLKLLSSRELFNK